jgi:3-oxoacyl-[acyl-carrier-protein] synthase-1
MRAGVRQVLETNLWDSTTGQYLCAGKVRLPQSWTGTERLAELVSPAIHECFAAASDPPERIPLIICVSALSRLGRPSDIDDVILEAVERRLRVSLHHSSGVIARDRVSGALALRHAAKVMREAGASYCVIAAADTLLEQSLVDHLLAVDRLVTELNPNGFFVGESGAAVLVTVDTVLPGGALRVLGLGFGQERATVESDEPLRAEGMIDAIGQALGQAGLSLDELQYRISDLNGEHYRFKEMVLAMLRYERQPKPKLFDLWHPIEYLGDVGAAIAPIVFGVALDAGRKRYGIGPRALCTFGNDDGERAAVVLEFLSGVAHA